MRIIFALCLIMIAPQFARGEPVYFTYLASVKAEQNAVYEDFLTKVKPVWAAHRMTLLARAHLLSHGQEDMGDRGFSEIGLLKAETRQDFQNYLASSDYQAIKQLRLDAVDRFIVLDGEKATIDGANFLKRTPLIAAIFARTTNGPQDAHFQLQVDLAAPVKGRVGTFFSKVKSVSLIALSFDDNPMAFGPDDPATARLLIGENLLRGE